MLLLAWLLPFTDSKSVRFPRGRSTIWYAEPTSWPRQASLRQQPRTQGVPHPAPPLRPPTAPGFAKAYWVIRQNHSCCSLGCFLQRPRFPRFCLHGSHRRRSHPERPRASVLSGEEFLPHAHVCVCVCVCVHKIVFSSEHERCQT